MLTKDEQLEMLIRQHYHAVYCYCIAKLKPDIQGAEECTQDVFLLLTEKKDSLDLNGNIRAWLFKSAKNIINTYIKNKHQHSEIPLDSVTILSAGGIETFFNETPLRKIRECLSVQEFQLLLEYYSLKRGCREELAAQYGMTIHQLYDEIERLKRKILCSQ